LQDLAWDDHAKAAAALHDAVDRLRAGGCFERAGLGGVDAVFLEEGLESSGLESCDRSDVVAAFAAKCV
jgi:hypothetical protein